jgi:hypothetical protein
MHGLGTQLLIDRGELCVNVVTQLAHFTHGEGVGVAQLDFRLQLGDPSILFSVIPGNGGVLMTCRVASAEDVAQAAVQQTKSSTSDSEAQTGPTDTLRCPTVLNFHKTSPFCRIPSGSRRLSHKKRAGTCEIPALFVYGLCHSSLALIDRCR